MKTRIVFEKGTAINHSHDRHTEQFGCEKDKSYLKFQIGLNNKKTLNIIKNIKIETKSIHARTHPCLGWDNWFSTKMINADDGPEKINDVMLTAKTDAILHTTSLGALQRYLYTRQKLQIEECQRKFQQYDFWDSKCCRASKTLIQFRSADKNGSRDTLPNYWQKPAIHTKRLENKNQRKTHTSFENCKPDFVCSVVENSKWVARRAPKLLAKTCDTQKKT